MKILKHLLNKFNEIKATLAIGWLCFIANQKEKIDEIYFNKKNFM